MMIGYPPEGYPKDAYPPPGYPPQGYPQGGYPPQGYPAQGYPPQYAQPPPQQQQSSGPSFLEGWYVHLSRSVDLMVLFRSGSWIWRSGIFGCSSVQSPAHDSGARWLSIVRLICPHHTSVLVGCGPRAHDNYRAHRGLARAVRRNWEPSQQ